MKEQSEDLCESCQRCISFDEIAHASCIDVGIDLAAEIVDAFIGRSYRQWN